ncbi:uncharacterized protein J4E88_002722 [Alternaria novae-zelandiae]|uniref:uncharacterized protein n=1 Tax=Alternaria novae-zelandiae TaxID=430562 RepID=UPI0020C33BE6|nr:uncharacterized protein J4E88_002722 [Alternaria novae-zelandiae]KAI4689370.1 hypothetical protein J4E88_002722 [Alternaria novae-zelandiae]
MLPIGWGGYAKDANTYFFICAFREMTGEVPGEASTAVDHSEESHGRSSKELQRISDFTGQIARLHKTALSPTGKFGFPVTTYGGRLPQDTTFCDSWEESFTRGIQRMFDLEELQHGHDKDMVQLRAYIVDKAIPRLLRPLETEGRSISACLVHGDLWDGNTGVDRNTRKPVIFDACSSYAHHEYDLAPWRLKRHKISGAYIAEYLKHYPASEPKEDFEHRNALYCIVKDEMKALLWSLFGDLEHAKVWQDTAVTGRSDRPSKL